MDITDQPCGLLHPLHILDLADEQASFTSKLLADLGAYVIKIEKPSGDTASQTEPIFPETRTSKNRLSFWYHNANKRGITLDIEKHEGKALFLKLLAKIDVVVESFAPGYLESLGLGFDVLSKENPGLILVSVTGFGQNGPRSRYLSCALVASAFGGSMGICGLPSTTPLKPSGQQPSYVASLYSAIAVLLALRKRTHGGKGAHIDISSQECVASTLDHVLVRYFHDGVVAKRQGNISWNRTSFILPCKDGYMYFTISSQWETLLDWMASEGMAEDLTDEAWKDEGYRQRNLAHIIDVLRKWTRTHSVQEFFELGQAMRFPWAPVVSPPDVLKSPQLQARDFFTHINHSEWQKSLNYPGMPYRFTPPIQSKTKRAPRSGEDNLRIYRDELGLSELEIRKLSALKVI